MASHRLVLQFDQSSVPGQVAGDSLLCRIPTVGGNGAVEQLAFPELSGSGRTFDQLVELTRRLLNDEGFYEEQLEALGKVRQLNIFLLPKASNRSPATFPGLLERGYCLT